MLFPRSNCRVIFVRPCPLELVLKTMPGISVNSFSSGVATVFAIVSAFAPG